MRTSSTSKNEIYDLFSIFVGHIVPSWIQNPDGEANLDTDLETPSILDPIRIRIQIDNTA